MLNQNKKTISNSIRNESIFSFLIKSSSVFFGLLSSILLARVLGPADLGLYAFCIGLLQVLIIPGSLGAQNLLVREISIFQSAKKIELIKGLLKRSYQGVFLFSLLISLLLGLYINVGIENDKKKDCMFLIILALPLFSTLIAKTSVLRGLGHVLYGQFFEILVKPLLFLIFLGYWFLIVKTRLTAEDALQIQLTVIIVTLILTSIILFFLLPKGIFSYESEYNTKYWLSSSLFFVLVSGFTTLNNNISIMILSSFGKDFDAGLFQVAYRGSDVILFCVIAVSSIVAPKISSLYSQKKNDDLQNLIIKTNKYIFFYTFFASIILIVFAKRLIIFLYGIEYVGSIFPFQILCISQCVNAGLGFSGMILNMIGRQRVTLFCIVLGLFLNILLNFVLIGNFGVLGAAFATGVGIVSWKLFATIILYYKCKIKSGPFIMIGR